MFFFSDENSSLAFKPGSLEHAYLAILNDDLLSAKKVFCSLSSPRARWGKALTDILSGYIEEYPSYFEIRNFLEIDLDFLLKNEKIDYVEQVLGSLNILSEINNETYKYVARVMYENKLYKVSREYLDKSKSLFYKDPELHFMYAKYYMNFGNYKDAEFHIDECIKILPDYYPAKLLKQEILSQLM